MSKYLIKNLTITLAALSLITSTITSSSPISIMILSAAVDNNDNNNIINPSPVSIQMD